jgi:hypothetical protein
MPPNRGSRQSDALQVSTDVWCGNLSVTSSWMPTGPTARPPLHLRPQMKLPPYFASKVLNGMAHLCPPDGAERCGRECAGRCERSRVLSGWLCWMSQKKRQSKSREDGMTGRFVWQPVDVNTGGPTRSALDSLALNVRRREKMAKLRAVYEHP